ncbi:hypothetical protein D910_09790 [Dendroctonus ponderosae]|uniref:Ig-like domain-containing protein n=1 Tax=Dendroctonus ponderosae TaxID=77166 RepID=U4UHH9_DENPD|nr:hypothetical protein D910_09790 [Dendroctonus ponderosae]
MFWLQKILLGLNGFHEEPHDITVYVGQKAHFSCYVDAVPTPRIRWLKDERPLQIDDLRMTILPSGALEIDEVVESDQGSYRHVHFPQILSRIAENFTILQIWLKDGFAIDMNDLDSRFALVGSTSSLRITKIQEQDGGTYQCRAENREDSLDASAAIEIQVN